MASIFYQFPQSESSDDEIEATMPQPTSGDSSLKELRKKLFKAAMSREWKKLLELYNDKQVQNQKITRNQDTVLHVAMSGAPEYVVLKLLGIVSHNKSPEEIKNILGSRNRGGDTPLHLAAALGLDKVCRKMAEMRPEMVTKTRNNLQETPLFTAVRHGKKQAFFVLEAAIHKQINLTYDNDSLSKRDITHCRRIDGNNILHYAIKGEHFDLAYEIIHLYPQLVNFFNTNAESALHILASMPSVFESGTSFGLIDAIIYNCLATKPLKLKFNDSNENEPYFELLDILIDETEALQPSTYKVCVDLYSLIKELMNRTYNTVASCLRTGICNACCADEENLSGPEKGDESKLSENQEQRRRIPPIYDVAFSFFKLIIKLLWVVLGIGTRRLDTIRKHKQKHREALKIMKNLVDQSTLWEYEDNSGGMVPSVETTGSAVEEEQTSPSSDSNIMIAAKEGGRDTLTKVLEKIFLEAKNVDKKDIVFIGMKVKESSNWSEPGSPVLVAAEKGVTEMVERILNKFPVAILDQDKDEKNIVLLAAEHRQVHVYKFMQGFVTTKNLVFGKVDKEGNSVLHWAAAANDPHTNTGAALQMQREIKWYKYVANSLDQEMLTTINNEGKAAAEVFVTTHEDQFKANREWLNSAATSFSVVIALIVTVAYMASSTVPGGFKSDSGFPIFQSNPDFQVFTLASLIALCFAVAALITFLGIIIRPYEIWDFEKVIPLKLIFGFTCSIISIGAMLVSFCAGHSFTVDGQLRRSAYVLYGVFCIPVFLSIKWLSNLYTYLLVTTFSKVPSFQ